MCGEAVLLGHCVSIFAGYPIVWPSGLLIWLCACAVHCVQSCRVWDFCVYVTVLPQGSFREARQWPACRKHLGQTMLSAQGCGFNASWIMWLGAQSQALTDAVDTNTNMYLLKGWHTAALQTGEEKLIGKTQFPLRNVTVKANNVASPAEQQN